MNWNTPLKEIDDLRKQVAALTKQRDAARDHASRLGDQIGEEARISDAQLAALTKERDDAIGVKKVAFHHYQETKNQLAASQAREAKLIGELRHIREYWNGSRNDRAMHDALTHIEEVVDAALALPQDDVALQQRLAEERERVIEQIDPEFDGLIAVIRSMKCETALIEAAKAASVPDHNENSRWYEYSDLIRDVIFYPKNARFIAACDPSTILELCALLEQANRAVQEADQIIRFEGCHYYLLGIEDRDDALAAIKQWKERPA